MNDNLLRILSIGGTILTMGGTLVSGIVADKKNDKKIEAKVIEMLAKQATK